MAEFIAHVGRAGGFDVTVLCDEDGPLRAAVEGAGASVRIAPRPPLDDLAGYERTLMEWSDWFEKRFDLVVGGSATSFPAVDLASRLGLPSMLRLGESAPLREVVWWLYGDLDPAVEQRARHAFAGASMVESSSHSGVRTYRSDGFNARYVVLDAGIDIERARADLEATDRAECRRRLGIEPDERLLLCAGGLWKVKAQAVLVAALAQLKDEHPRLTCALLGPTDPLYALRIYEFLAESGMHTRVRIVPFCENLRPWWRAADVAVCPSESEGRPAAVLEAMAYGLPVLGSRVGDIPLLVTPGLTGWLFDHSDLGALIAELEHMASSPTEVLRLMGAAAHNAAAAYDGSKHLQRWTEMLRETAHGSR